MMDEDIVLIELRGNRPVPGERIGGDKGRIIREPHRRGKLVQPAEVDQTSGDVDIGGTERAFLLALFEPQLPLQQVAEGRWHRRLDLDAQDRPVLLPRQLLFYSLQKVCRRRLVELQVAAPREAERMGGGNYASGIQEVEVD